ncbi:hypothetical protein [Actinopolymorpha alba]|uniref:hypothetical protein n=1 Tax=Actinopolymorpha alba TaxID=533267 RepID=UPI00039BFDD6|nr:hypothetical protein [Actinopolymorpha alba]
MHLVQRGEDEESEPKDGPGEVMRLDEASARRLTERIRVLLEAVQEQVDELVRLVEEARDCSAHLALGYRSWTEYAEREFGQMPLRLPKQDRQELVVRLGDMGMSSRAIAPIAGVDSATVRRDLSGGATAPPDSRAGGGRPADDDPAPVSPVSGETGEKPRAVTGRDGKEYVVHPKQEPEADEEVVDSAPVDEPEPRRQPEQRPRGSRTNVVAVMAKVINKSADAAAAAGQIRREHLKSRSEEATRWARDLNDAIQSLQRLADLLEETE